MKKHLGYLRESYQNSKRKIFALFSFFLGAWGLINVILDKEVLSLILFAGLIVLCVVSLVIIAKWYVSLIRGRMTLSLFGKRKVTLLRADFQVNMDRMLRNATSEYLSNFAFVMGIDRTGRLDISSHSGVVYWVMKYLDENYTCNEKKPSEIMQQRLSDEMQRNKWVRKGLPYGECVNVSMLLERIEDKTAVPCNLILVANSRKRKDGKEDEIEAMEDDHMSHIIVPSVFDCIHKERRYKGVMMGVIGTNGMKQPYSVMFSQILNQFARVCYGDQTLPLRELFISIRELDYTNWGMTLTQLAGYVRHLAGFYKSEEFV